MKYTEQQLINWIAPLSATEDNRTQQNIFMIKSTIDSATNLNGIDIEVSCNDYTRMIQMSVITAMWMFV